MSTKAQPKSSKGKEKETAASAAALAEDPNAPDEDVPAPAVSTVSVLSAARAEKTRKEIDDEFDIKELTASEFAQIVEAIALMVSHAGNVAEWAKALEYLSVNYALLVAYTQKMHSVWQAEDPAKNTWEWDECVVRVLGWVVSRQGNWTARSANKTRKPKFLEFMRACRALGVTNKKANELAPYQPNIPRMGIAFLSTIAEVHRDTQGKYVKVKLPAGMSTSKHYLFPGAVGMWPVNTKHNYLRIYALVQYAFSLQIRSREEKRKELTNQMKIAFLDDALKFTYIVWANTTHIPDATKDAFCKGMNLGTSLEALQKFLTLDQEVLDETVFDRDPVAWA